MNRIIVPIASSMATDQNFISDKAYDDLYATGTYCPWPKQIIYKKGERKIPDVTSKNDAGDTVVVPGKAYPILTTIVFWDDGTKTVVQNSENDPVSFNTDGTPTLESKEHGFLYALAKRMCSQLIRDENGIVTGLKPEGFGRMLQRLMANEQLPDAPKASSTPKESKTPAPRKRNPSLAKCVIDLSDAIKDLKATIDLLKADKSEMSAHELHG